MTALDGKRIAISISDAPDRGKLGFPVTEIHRAIFSICTGLIRAGAEIIYSGNLESEGLTFKIFRHLVGAYAGADKIPFVHAIPEPDVRKIGFVPLFETIARRKGIADTQIILGGIGYRIRRSGDALFIENPGSSHLIVNDNQLAEWLSQAPSITVAEGYFQARNYVTAITDGRVAMGGKMGIVSIPEDQYLGNRPGIVEEAIITLERNSPLVPLAAFGGATRDVAIALKLLSGDQRVPRGIQVNSYDGSIRELASLADRIPRGVHNLLERIAKEDRSETLSILIIDALLGWDVA
jgi:hypothetical protein